MNTHELARSLNVLARALRAGPKVELDKLLRYLEKSPEARNRLRRTTPSDKASPELLKALASLLKE